ncbi:hypothetical protein CH313_15880 [Streptomyces sp. TSRI0384-2]|nr:hypothetical protein CH313_15880 [Streptomyces sp. TSRI0384-2]
MSTQSHPHDSETAVAVVGMACRYPGAPDVRSFWHALRSGSEGITQFKRDDLVAAGADPDLVWHPDYVAARGVLDGSRSFDWRAFGYSRAEAALLDPQHRVFLECAAAALDDAALDPARFPGWIGLYAGSEGPVLPQRDDVDALAQMIGRRPDFLTTRAAYKLGLRGPAVTVQTACSTSLTAVHTAVQSLLSYECDAALAGGVSLAPQGEWGYLYQEGGILSPDGHCRPFDEEARGTVPGEGVGLVVLKRLDDALRDDDRIAGVLLGTALNNDGSDKIGYTAPSLGTARRDPARAEDGRRRPGRDRLRRGARDRHQDGRPGRTPGAHRCVPHVDRGGARLLDRRRQEQHRPHGLRVRRGGTHQDPAHAGARGARPHPPLPAAQPAARPGLHPLRGVRAARAVARARRRAPSPRRRQLLRGRRHQRSCGAGPGSGTGPARRCPRRPPAARPLGHVGALPRRPARRTGRRPRLRRRARGRRRVARAGRPDPRRPPASSLAPGRGRGRLRERGRHPARGGPPRLPGGPGPRRLPPARPGHPHRRGGRRRVPAPALLPRRLRHLAGDRARRVRGRPRPRRRRTGRPGRVVRGHRAPAARAARAGPHPGPEPHGPRCDAERPAREQHRRVHGRDARRGVVPGAGRPSRPCPGHRHAGHRARPDGRRHRLPRRAGCPPGPGASRCRGRRRRPRPHRPGRPLRGHGPAARRRHPRRARRTAARRAARLPLLRHDGGGRRAARRRRRRALPGARPARGGQLHRNLGRPGAPAHPRPLGPSAARHRTPGERADNPPRRGVRPLRRAGPRNVDDRGAAPAHRVGPGAHDRAVHRRRAGPRRSHPAAGSGHSVGAGRRHRPRGTRRYPAAPAPLAARAELRPRGTGGRRRSHHRPGRLRASPAAFS